MEPDTAIMASPTNEYISILRAFATFALSPFDKVIVSPDTVPTMTALTPAIRATILVTFVSIPFDPTTGLDVCAPPQKAELDCAFETLHAWLELL